MWRNYLTVGVRALAKNRTYALINILGLAIGMAACLMILLFVRYEFSYDKWLPNADNVYQLQSWYKGGETGGDDELQMSPIPAADALKKDFPEVEAYAYAFRTAPVVIQGGEAVTLEDFLFTGQDLLAVIELPMVHGTRNALAQPGMAVLTRSEAVRRFGTEDVVGRTLSVISRGQTRDLRITGVIEDLPKNSHIRASTIARVDLNTYFADAPQALTCWGCQNGYNYFKLKPGTDVAAIEAQFPAWEKRNIPDQSTGEARFNAGDDQEFRLVNVKDVHLGEGQGGSMSPGNDRGTIVTFGVIALLILGMAIVNFTNLATARASQRAREVALRKVLGATRRQLILQFMGEAMLIAAVAMLIALTFVELLMPAFAAFLKADIDVRYFGADGILLPVIGLMLAVGALSGLYPAFVLSRYQPAQVLKANKSAAETSGAGRLRSVLVVGQFAVSIGLIVCTAVIYLQTIHARTVDPGFRRDGVLQVSEFTRYSMMTQGKAIEDRVRRIPGVTAVGMTSIGIATPNNNNTTVMVPGRAEPELIGNYQASPGLKEALGLKLLAGRWFEEGREMDSAEQGFPRSDAIQRHLITRGINVVISAKASQRLGFAKPQDAIGKTLRAALVNPELGLVPVTIIGVIRDPRFRSVRTGIDPLMFNGARIGTTEMIVRFEGDPAALRDRVEQVWKSFTRDVPFNAKFSDDIMIELYEAEDARAQTFAGFALLAAIVACLGLFGLAAFTAERRTKEIGMRKVLGARTSDIVRLLVWQFSKPVIVANLIAWPVAWWVMTDWLRGFDTRIPLTPVPFLIAGGLALLIAIATIGSHAFRVARANPINALRYE